MFTSVQRICIGAICGIGIIAAAGCNSPVGMAVQVVGKVMDDQQAKKLGNELLGKGASSVDASLGQPLDVWRETRGAREWRVYSVGGDILGNERYVAQLTNGKVAGIAKVYIDKTGLDMARKLMLDQKVTGKTPRECEEALGMGPPLVTAKNEKSGMMAQLYNAQMVQGVGSMQYCRLLFDSSGHCTECKLIDLGGSVGQTPRG